MSSNSAHKNHAVGLSPFRPASPASSVSSSSSSTSSSALYIPVHKRQRSLSRSDDSFSSLSSSRPSSPAAESDTGAELIYHTGIYTPEMLLALRQSPLAVMSKETRDKLRDTVPGAIMSRKQRKGIEFRERTSQQSKTVENHNTQPHRQPTPTPASAQLLLQQQQQQQPLQSQSQLQESPVQVGLLRPLDRRAVQPQADHHTHASNQLHQKRWNVNGRQSAVQDVNWRRATAAATPISVA